MTLSDLAALGSFASGIAVIVTLVFLILQLRQSARATMSSAMGTWLGDYNAMLLRVSTDASFSLLIRRGLTEMQSLDLNDQSRFHDYMSLVYLNAFYLYKQRKVGAFDPDLANNVFGVTAAMLKMKGGREWWDLMRRYTVPEFQEFIDMRIAEEDAAPDVMPFFAAESGGAGSIKSE